MSSKDFCIVKECESAVLATQAGNLIHSKRQGLDTMRFKVGLVQLRVGKDKLANLERMRAKVLEASKNGAELIVLPVRNVIYGIVLFPGIL